MMGEGHREAGGGGCMADSRQRHGGGHRKAEPRMPHGGRRHLARAVERWSNRQGNDEGCRGGVTVGAAGRQSCGGCREADDIWQGP